MKIFVFLLRINSGICIGVYFSVKLKMRIFAREKKREKPATAGPSRLPILKERRTLQKLYN